MGKQLQRTLKHLRKTFGDASDCHWTTEDMAILEFWMGKF